MTVVQGSALAVTSQSRDKEAAFTFAHWLTTKGMRRLVGVEAPSYLPLARSDAFVGRGDLPAAKHVALGAMRYARPPMQHPAYARLTDAFTPLMDSASRGLIPAADAARRGAAEANRVLDRYWEARRDD